MFWQRFIALVVIGGILFSQPGASPVAAAPCDAVQFIADVSIPDGALLSGGASFTKIWRVKNSGTCAWTTDYSLAFVSGDQMGAPATLALPSAVAPGQTADLSAGMVAPGASGHYRGNWKLKNATGGLFGVGSSGSDPFWVDINVVATEQVAFDFVANAPYAYWRSGAGALPFPGTSGDGRGYALQLDSPHLEDGSYDTTPGLLTVPQNKYNGYIQAVYPEFIVQKGDHFQSLVNCEYGATNCYVTFRLDYLTDSGVTKVFWTWREAYEKRFYRANVNLSPLAGQKVRFILTLLSTGLASDDRAIWGSPRIIRAGSAGDPLPATLTPLPPFTPTATPLDSPPTISPANCDRASLVADVTARDGTVFTPNAAFIKTWRIKNVGSCTWTTDYSLLFYSGERMNGPTLANLPSAIAPGQTVDLILNLVAPSTAGEYRGYWIFRNPSGALFGVGSGSSSPFWVDISVAGESPGSDGYDFVANMCAAQWISGAGTLPCPGTDGDPRGFVLKLDAPHEEDGTVSDQPGLLTMPQNTYNGYLQGIYPTFTVQAGDHFRAVVGCEYAVSCYVTYRLDYLTSTGLAKIYWKWQEMNQRHASSIDVDLSPLAGQSVRFVLTMLATGLPTNDRALWVAPRIVRESNPLPTPTVTPTPTLTPTATPTASPTSPPMSDWLTYTNTKYGFQFKYPPDAPLATAQDNYVHISLPFTLGTNLGEKSLDVNVLENADPCNSPLVQGLPYSTSELVTLNGIPFLKQTGTDRGAGQIYDWTVYSTFRGNVCVTFAFILHSGNPNNYDPPIPQFDRTAESAVFEQIVSTFTWLAPTPTMTSTATSTPTPTPGVTPTATMPSPSPTMTFPAATTFPSPTPSGTWQTYTNAPNSFQFMYPPGGQIIQSEDNYVYINLPIVAGTNLVSKYLEARAGSDLGLCNLGDVQTVVLNGIAFLKQTGRDQGAGQIRDVVTYATVKANTCLTLTFVLHSGNPGNYDPPVPEFDMAAESAVFEQMLSTFTWLTPTPVPATMGPYAVFLRGTNDPLPIYSSAGDNNAVVGSLPATTITVMRTGASTQVAGQTWVEVQNPSSGTGWVNADYLTEYVSPDAFCGDSRVVPLVQQFMQSAQQSNGTLLSSLVSPLHGVDIRLWSYQPAVNFSASQASGIYQNAQSYNWGTGPSGTNDVGTFTTVVQPTLLDVMDNSGLQLRCNDASLLGPVPNRWPGDYNGTNFYALYKPGTPGVDIDFAIWLVGFEYINGQPYLLGLMRYVWEP